MHTLSEHVPLQEQVEASERLAFLMVQVHSLFAWEVMVYVTCRGHLSPEGSSEALRVQGCRKMLCYGGGGGAPVTMAKMPPI